jgi:hypothetical protein
VGGIGPPISMPNQSAVYVKLNDIEWLICWYEIKPRGNLSNASTGLNWLFLHHFGGSPTASR